MFIAFYRLLLNPSGSMFFRPRTRQFGFWRQFYSFWLMAIFLQQPLDLTLNLTPCAAPDVPALYIITAIFPGPREV
jgi:hypothetical protein